MKNKKNYLAYENIKDFDYTQFCYSEIFNIMKNELFDAFDAVSTFDMRKLSQVSLRSEDCEWDSVFEKDDVIYPAVKLVVLVRDWNFIKNQPCRYRSAEFELTLTPFNANLEKFKEKTGVYGAYNKELTKAWRRFLKLTFPKYEQSCREFCGKVKELKMQQARNEFNSKEEKIDKEYNEDVSLI